MSVAGPCEWCGGPQSWTIIRGDMYVSCDGGCQPLPLDGLVPPPDSPELEGGPVMWVKEPIEEEGVVPCEGGDARTTVLKREYPGEPPPEFLKTLWEGSDA